MNSRVLFYRRQSFVIIGGFPTSFRPRLACSQRLCGGGTLRGGEGCPGACGPVGAAAPAPPAAESGGERGRRRGGAGRGAAGDSRGSRRPAPRHIRLGDGVARRGAGPGIEGRRLGGRLRGDERCRVLRRPAQAGAAGAAAVPLGHAGVAAPLRARRPPEEPRTALRPAGQGGGDQARGASAARRLMLRAAGGAAGAPSPAPGGRAPHGPEHQARAGGTPGGELQRNKDAGKKRM